MSTSPPIAQSCHRTCPITTNISKRPPLRCGLVSPHAASQASSWLVHERLTPLCHATPRNSVAPDEAASMFVSVPSVAIGPRCLGLPLSCAVSRLAPWPLSSLPPTPFALTPGPPPPRSCDGVRDSAGKGECPLRTLVSGAPPMGCTAGGLLRPRRRRPRRSEPRPPPPLGPPRRLALICPAVPCVASGVAPPRRVVAMLAQGPRGRSVDARVDAALARPASLGTHGARRRRPLRRCARRVGATTGSGRRCGPLVA